MTHEQFKKRIDKYGFYREEFFNIEKSETLLEKCWKISVFIGHLYYERIVSQEVSYAELMIITSNFIDDCFFKAKVHTQCKLLNGAFAK